MAAATWTAAGDGGGALRGNSAADTAAPRGGGADTEEKLAAAYAGLISAVGEDVSREGLRKTPGRAARAMMKFTGGYRESLERIVNDAVFHEPAAASGGAGMVIVRDIELFSLCEHHLVPFWGRAHVAYVPDGRVIGLSKIARIVEMFARRLQVQERLTREIAAAVGAVLAPRGVAVVVEAQHMCMSMRGVQKSGSSTVTSAMVGDFETDAALRAELHAHLARDGLGSRL